MASRWFESGCTSIMMETDGTGACLTWIEQRLSSRAGFARGGEPSGRAGPVASYLSLVAKRRKKSSQAVGETLAQPGDIEQLAGKSAMVLSSPVPTLRNPSSA